MLEGCATVARSHDEATIAVTGVAGDVDDATTDATAEVTTMEDTVIGTTAVETMAVEDLTVLDLIIEDTFAVLAAFVGSLLVQLLLTVVLLVGGRAPTG